MADAQTIESGAEATVTQRVEAVLDTLRPYIQQDGGDLELVDVSEGVVQIRLAGACVGCMHSMMTLQAGVERMIRDQVPEVVAVEAVPF